MLARFKKHVYNNRLKYGLAVAAPIIAASGAYAGYKYQPEIDDYIHGDLTEEQAQNIINQYTLAAQK
jgi:hypothetical protein